MRGPENRFVDCLPAKSLECVVCEPVFPIETPSKKPRNIGGALKARHLATPTNVSRKNVFSGPTGSNDDQLVQRTYQELAVQWRSKCH